MKSVYALVLFAGTIGLECAVPQSLEWIPRRAAGAPPARWDSAMVYDHARGCTLMVGGNLFVLRHGSEFRDTWRWDGFEWERATPTREPTILYPAGITYDSHRQVVVLVGLPSPAGTQHETWEWDGTDWRRRQTPLAPSRFAYPGLAFDTARRRTVLVVPDETWEWDGASWTRIQTTRVPPLGFFGSPPMVYDSFHAVTVLHTRTQSGEETWTYDGSDWALASRLTNRLIAGLPREVAYDPTRRRVLMPAFIHTPPSPMPDPVLGVWDGIQWAFVPTDRAMRTNGLAFDPQRRALVMGGASGGAFGTREQVLHELFLPGTASFTRFSSGCTGPFGTPMLDTLQGDRPWLGQTFSMRLSNLDPAGTTLPIGIVGLSRIANTQGIPTPVDLGPLIGSPGCLWHVDPFSFTVLGNNQGSARWDLAIPGNPALRGSLFYAQALVGSIFQPLQGARVSNPGEGLLGMVPPEHQLTESFDDDLFFDRNVSSGGWGGSVSVPGLLGGDGRHGSFDPALGVQVAQDVYEWSTDNMLIPASHTLTGRDERVANGRFSFTDMQIPAGVTVRFTGNSPAVLRVRGNAVVDGRLLANGEAMTGFRARDPLSTALLPGQDGGAGGAGGGSGGQGGDRSDGNGPRIVWGVNTNDGRPGEDVLVVAGHAYAGRVPGTGGQGSAMFPASGMNASVTHPVAGAFSGQLGAGGGGGGYCGPGQAGRALQSASGSPFDLGPRALPGNAFDLFPIPASVSSLDHYLVGGSGGGGGGSHPYLAVRNAFPDTWKGGAGGSGGGGALAVRCGRDLTVAGAVEAKGGAGFSFTSFDDGVPAPGGGGSGGSLLLQTIGDLTVSGTLDVSGGDGSRVGPVVPMALTGDSRGGAGAPGHARLERMGTLSLTGSATPPLTSTQLGTATDRDAKSGVRSLWYSHGRQSLPVYLRYEVDATVDGQAMTFSDDPAFGTVPGPGSPLLLRLQGTPPGPATGRPDPEQTGPWRSSADALNRDRAAFFRFDLVFDTAAVQSVRVMEVRVVFQ